MSLCIMVINLLMQDILSFIDKKEGKGKQAISNLENYDGQHLQIHTANFMLKVSPSGCIFTVFKQ